MPVRSAKKSKKIAAKRNKGFSWKRSKAARKARKKIRLLFFAIVSLLLTTLLLTAFSIYKFAKAPLLSASLGSLEKNEDWDGKEEMNILFLMVDDFGRSAPKLESLYVLRIVPQNQNYFIIKLPISAECDLAERYGVGDIAKAFAIGDVRLVQETVFKQLAIYSDSYVLTDLKGLSEIKNIFGEIDLKNIRKSTPATKLYINPNFLKFLHENVKSNLSIKDLFNILSFVRSTDSINAKVFELNDDSFEDKELFDGFWNEYILQGIAGEENSRILVLNGAEVPGLATWGGRVVSNSGFTLLDVGNTKKKYEESFLISGDPQSNLSQELSHIFGISVIKDRISIEDEDEIFLRGDIVVVLGLDIGSVL